MKQVWNMPGPGGNLGKCAVCGDTFLSEILFGEQVKVMGLEGLDKDFCLHLKCVPMIDKVQASGDWRDFPAGPLREFFEKHASEVR